jgi:starvation-inducible outer membrane lipoprotein
MFVKNDWMRGGFVKKLLIVMFSLFLMACTTMDSAMNSWMGRNIDDVVRVWGSPASVTQNRSGGATYTWITLSSNQYGVRQCSQSFSTNNLGTIEFYSYANCPRVVRNF